MPATVICALFVALGLNRISDLRWRNVWASMYFLPFATSLVAAALVWQWIYEPVYGFLNYALSFVGIPPQKWLQSLVEVRPAIAAVSVWVRIGFDTMIFLAALQSIPGEYYEAARIDGANAWQRLRYITLPMLSPTFVFVGIITAIGYLQLFPEPYVMTGGGPVNATLSVVMLMYERGFKFWNMGYAAAVAFILFVFIAIATLLQLKAQKARI